MSKFCRRQVDCSRGEVCDVVENRCITRRDPRASVILRGLSGGPGNQTPPTGAVPRRPSWTMRPGQSGFNAYAIQKFRRSRLGKNPPNCGPDKLATPPQDFVSFMVRPGTPVDSFGVCHLVGSGKSKEMAQILTNFFYDQRKKVVMVLNSTQEVNFYSDFFKWDSPWLKFVQKSPDPDRPTRTMEQKYSSVPDKDKEKSKFRKYVLKAKKILMWHKHQNKKPADPAPGVPAPGAAFRVYHYTNQAAFDAKNYFLKANRELGGNNPFDNCVIICDECQNLYNDKYDNIRHKRIAAELSTKLKSAEGSIRVFFTGTPIHTNDPAKDVQEFRSLVRGRIPAADNDEGLFSWYMNRPSTQFARQHRSIEVMPRVIYSVLRGEHLRKYLQMRCGGQKTTKIEKIKYEKCAKGKPGERAEIASKVKGAQAWENTSFRADRRADGAAYNEVDNFSENDLAEAAIKFWTILDLIKKQNGKIVIQIYKSSGSQFLIRVLKKFLGPTKVLSVEKTKTDAQNAKAIDNFNNDISNNANIPVNINGGIHKVIVLESEIAKESISLFNVRLIIMADVSPRHENPKWSTFKQRAARALRMCGHEGLTDKKKKLRIRLVLSKMPGPEAQSGLNTQFNNSPLLTLDEIKLSELSDDRDRIVAEEEKLKGLAVDSTLYDEKNPTPIEVEDEDQN